MLISKQQQYVLDILKRLGCVRNEQLEKMLKARFYPEGKPLPPGFLDTLLRRLRCCGIEMRQEGETVFLPGNRSDYVLRDMSRASIDFAVTHVDHKAGHLRQGANPNSFDGAGPHHPGGSHRQAQIVGKY